MMCLLWLMLTPLQKGRGSIFKVSEDSHHREGLKLIEMFRPIPDSTKRPHFFEAMITLKGSTLK